jgi:uncharacterized protein YcbK (DUF882 family)
MNGQAFSGCLSRRRFTFGLATPLALALIGLPTRQAEAARRERSLLLHHLHTGETLKAVYFADGRYLPDGLRAITHHLRDWRVDQTRPIDPELLDLVWAVRQRLESSAPVHVLLRRRSHGVARNSLHLRGMAIDLRVPDRSLRMLRSAALSLKGGGVGYYPRSDFVHVDSGSVRSW